MQLKYSRALAILLCIVLILGLTPQGWALGINDTQVRQTEEETSNNTDGSAANDSDDAGGSDNQELPDGAGVDDQSDLDDQEFTDAVGDQSPAEDQDAQVGTLAVTPSVLYRTHVQNLAWLEWQRDGELSGTTARSLRLEALEIKLENADGSIVYNAHVQDVGWQKNTQNPGQWFKDGAMAGLTGQSKRVEAIQISLTGEIANQYDVYYRTHATNFGWLAWAKNGASSGTAGLTYRLESLEIVLVAKSGGSAPVSTDYTTAAASKYASIDANTISAAIGTHVSDHGWLKNVGLGQIAGTIGQSKRLEALKITPSSSISMGFEYSAHVQDIGWMPSVSNGAQAGTTNQSKRIEAITIKITGDAADLFDVYYRVHSQEFGWLGWAKNGERAGTAGYSYRAEAIQVVLVAHGSPAPGATGLAYNEYVPSWLNGIDVSGWQPADIGWRVNYDFMIVKASGGTTFTSSVLSQQADAALARGKQLGFYHYAAEYHSQNSAAAEAAHFVNAVRPYIGRAALFLDYEEDLPGNDREWVLAFCREVKRLTGVSCNIYTSGSWAQNYINGAWDELGVMLWQANYWYSTVPGLGYRQNIKPMMPCSIYQYTSEGRLPGYLGNLDLNVFYGSAADWAWRASH